MNDVRGARWASGLAQLAASGTAGFFAAIAWSTALQPATYDSTRDLVSGLAGRGASYPGLMMFGFEVMAVALVAIAVGLFGRFHAWSGRVAGVLVLVSAAGMAVAGLARFDCTMQDAACEARLADGLSTSGALHGLAALFVFLPLIAATFLLAVAAGRDTTLYGVPLRRAAVLIGVVQLGLTFVVESGVTGFSGLFQRIDLVLLFGTPLLVAFGRWGARLPLEVRAEVPAAGDSELAVDSGQVHLDGLGGDEEGLGDLPVGGSARGELSNS
jgi:hypothetical protein